MPLFFVALRVFLNGLIPDFGGLPSSGLGEISVDQKMQKCHEPDSGLPLCQVSRVRVLKYEIKTLYVCVFCVECLHPKLFFSMKNSASRKLNLKVASMQNGSVGVLSFNAI